jgi:hypothetical protein
MRVFQDELTNAQDKLSKTTDPQQKRRLQGDVDALLNEISRKSKTPLAPKQTQQPPQDELGAMILGKQAQPGQPSQQESTAGGGRGSYAGFDPQAKAIAEGQSTRGPRQPEGTSVGRMAGRLLGQVQENKQALGERVLGGIDTLYGVVPAVYGAGVQALARTANTPQEAERIGQQAAATIDKPLGKAFGITGKQTYQQPLGGVTEPVAKEVNKMFNVLGMTPEQIFAWAVQNLTERI